ncbi:MAG: hypothetical protein IJH37_12760 [Clostridia bacterium]|nr:hypothetical protein [Clostridia bacterium]
MYSDNFFKNKDISTVSNNYMANKIKLRYIFYYNKLLKQQSIFKGDFVNTLLQICFGHWEEPIEKLELRNDIEEVFDESISAGVDGFSNILKWCEDNNSEIEKLIDRINASSQVISETVPSFLFNTGARPVIYSFLMECIEIIRLNDDKIKDKIKNNKITGFLLENDEEIQYDPPFFKLKNREIQYNDLQKSIFKYIRTLFKNKCIAIKSYNIGGNYTVEYIELGNSLNRISESFCYDVLYLILALSTKNEYKHIESLSNALYNLNKTNSIDKANSNIDEEGTVEEYDSDKKNKLAFRKKYKRFCKSASFQLFEGKYFNDLKQSSNANNKSCEKAKNHVSDVLEAQFMFHVINGDLNYIENSESESGYTKKTLKNNLKRIYEACKNDCTVRYQVEQHFFLYSSYHMSKYMDSKAEETNDSDESLYQTMFICSQLYDIPFALTRLELARQLAKNAKTKTNANAEIISLIDFKYYLYNIAQKIYDKFTPYAKKTKEQVTPIDNPIIRNEYWFGDLIDGLKSDMNKTMGTLRKPLDKEYLEHSQLVQLIFCQLCGHEKHNSYDKIYKNIYNWTCKNMGLIFPVACAEKSKKGDVNNSTKINITKPSVEEIINATKPENDICT